MTPAEIGIIGGSGFYSFLEDADEVAVDTPYGPPSSPVTLGELGGRTVAFLARHGRGHDHPPHRVNYRANVWALRSLGVRRVLGPCAAGSLRADLARGDFVVCDQIVDRTWGRPDTYHDGPGPQHVSFAHPYCDEMRQSLLTAGRAVGGGAVHDGGTVVVIQGPRFSTRAESQWFAQMGWDLVNMTQYPEAYLARDLGLCYGTIAVVTDHDAGLDGADGIEPVTMEEVFATFDRSLERLRRALALAVARVPAERACACADHLAG